VDANLSPIKTITVKPMDAGYEAYSRPLPPRGSDYLDDDDAGVLEYWRILKRRKGTIVLFAFLGFVAAVLIGLPQTPVYRAAATLEIKDVNNDFMRQGQMNPVDGEADSDVQTQILVLESDTLFDRVADKINAAYKNVDFPWRRGFVWAINAELMKLQHQPPPDPEPLITPNNLRVRPQGPTRIVEVSYDSPDPRLAADVVNTLASEYMESEMEARLKMSEHTGQWLSRQLQDMRGALERSEAAMQAYAQRTGLVFTGDTAQKINIADEKLLQLQTELSRAQDDRVSIQSRYEMTKGAPVETLPDILNDSSLRNMQDKLTDLRRQHADLTVVYTANDEKVKRINAQIAPLQAALEKDRKDILDRIRNEYDTAVRRENLLRAEYAEQSRIVTDQGEKSIQYNLLNREVESNRQLYESMIQQVKQANVAAAITASNIRLLDKAKIPFYIHSPNYGLNAIVGILTGILAGVTLIVVRARSNSTLQHPGEMQFWLNVPELGVIRTVTKDRRIYFRRKSLNGLGPAEGTLLEPKKPSRKEMVELVTWHRKPSSASESFRAVLASILFSSQEETRAKVLVLTSATPGEGKTMVASNLAIALSEIQRKVLLIDADMRKPRIHSLFELSNERGLSTFLRERELPSEAVTLDGLAQPTFIPNLFILPSGPAAPAAANLLHSPHLLELLSTCRKEFDTVIIDTPPVQEMSDARVLGSLSDAVILVIRAGQTTRAAAAAVAQRFAEDNTRVLGAILNDWDPKRSPRG
jgi:polysaccharide biosynthesis transport protein